MRLCYMKCIYAIFNFVSVYATFVQPKNESHNFGVVPTTHICMNTAAFMYYLQNRSFLAVDMTKIVCVRTFFLNNLMYSKFLRKTQ